MQATALTAAVQFVDSDTGRTYTVKLIPENQLTDDPSGRFPVGPIGWRDGRLPFTFSDVEGEPHEEARHVGNLFNLRREVIDGVTWVVADLDWDTDELALEAKRLVDEERITGVSIHATDLDAYLICGVPEVPNKEAVLADAADFNPDECPTTEWVEAWVNVVIGSATLLMLPAFEEAEVVTADALGGQGAATDETAWNASEAMRKAGAAEDPAAAFRAIAIETTTGEPSERQHWALPHHKTPGGPANAAAVRNARARFEQTQNLKDKDAARAHLFEVHKLPSEVEEAASVGEIMEEVLTSAVDFEREANWGGLERSRFTGEVESWGKAWIAAVDVKRPPSEWFGDPGLTEPTPLEIDDEGRVKGHLALWSTCHRGFDSQCVTPPQDSTEYGEFHANARVILESGESLGVGCLTFDVSHADVRASSEAAKRHYDHSGTVAAFVRAGQDEWGVWVAGAIRPGLTDDQIEMMRRLSLSGDWRPKNGQYHLIAAQAVPVPGFPIRARVASGVVEELTTRGPAQVEEPEDAIAAALHKEPDWALVATSLIRLNQKLDMLLEEKNLRDYEKAMAVLTVTAEESHSTP